MGYLKDLKKAQNFTLTENFAKSHKSTLNPLLDFYSLGGALRGRSKEAIIRLFSKALEKAPLLSLKCLFYLRDIRGGQGERRTFRRILRYLGDNYPKIVGKNIHNIPFYGRWDDLYALEGTQSERYALRLLADQLYEDLDSEHPSLAAKWAKSVNTSSDESCRLGRVTADFMGLNEAEYRKMLSKLRRKIGVVEQKMCANEWKKIDYERVPSNAMLLYRNAFKEHDPDGFEQYIEDVKSGDKKINTSTLYPYDILRKAVREDMKPSEIDVIWDNQKDWTEGDENSIVVCDTSGSMTGTYWGTTERTVEPILVAVSLSIYFGERNEGRFHNHFITFSIHPRLQKIVGNTLTEKYCNLEKADWDGNTDLQAVFDLLLNTAIRNFTPPEEMIDKIYIISDMEFDFCTNHAATNFEAIERKYEEAGYKRPTLVFWNVDARQDQAPITVNDDDVFLVSGCSPSIFKNLMQSKATSAVDLMLEVLQDERYDRINF